MNPVIKRIVLAAGMGVASSGAFAQVFTDGMEMPVPAYPSGQPQNVRKLTGGTLTCEQIYAESSGLEKTIATHKSTLDAAQQEAMQAQDSMLSSSMGGGMASMATSMLGMVPGAGMASSLVAQAQAAAQMAAAQQSASSMSHAYQRVAAAGEAMAHAQARNDYLIGMFLQRQCKVPATPATQ